MFTTGMEVTGPLFANTDGTSGLLIAIARRVITVNKYETRQYGASGASI